MNESVICIMNVYLRPQWFEEQLQAIRNQTVKPKLIIVWNNNKDVNLNKYNDDKDILIITASRNLGVWARFFHYIIYLMPNISVYLMMIQYRRKDG